MAQRFALMDGRQWLARLGLALGFVLALLLAVMPVSTHAQVRPDPEAGPGGPILVLTQGQADFGRYYAEILRNEGLNHFAVADVSTLSAASLAAYDVVVLAKATITPAQASVLTTWVQAGGNLIAMAPDASLAGLLGITPAGGTLSDAYLLIDTAQAPGAGIVGQTIQFHGTATRYSLNGAVALATLYSNATTPTANPAVTLRALGGGRAAAFAYDLATSIVQTRQGNPQWAAQERDGAAPIRSNDKFFGASTSDPQPDWVDPSKVSIPQADEQQRFFANLVLFMNQNRKPLPRFWYFPNDKKAVIVMTGDDHGAGGTVGRFDQFLSQSTPGCSVANWECIRGTSYTYPATSMTAEQAATYTGQGFEVGLHVTTNCLDYDAASLTAAYASQATAFAQNLPGTGPLRTQRHHCIVWSDWTTGAEVQLANGIHLDTTYYYWPASWVGNVPGMFTGSAMPMRFARTNGSLVDVYMAATLMTDESGQAYPFTVNTLLDRALGAEGYFGAYVINAQNDLATNPASDAAVSSAVARGVSVISANQLLTWVDARNASSFGGFTYSGGVLTFSVARDPAANGLRAMLPLRAGSSTLTTLTRNGAAVAFTSQLIKGVDYAFFDAVGGTYSATYAADATSPTIVSAVPAAGATGVVATTAIRVTFSEPMDPATINASTVQLLDASLAPVAGSVTYDPAARAAIFTPGAALTGQTVHTVRVLGGTTDPRVKDESGNALATTQSWTFTTEAGPQCPCSAWGASAVPGTPSSGDTTAVELGVKFTSDANGYITGVRFYKGAANTGTHVGNLWTASGTLLASAVFTSETATGWQQVSFAAPVQITANTVYVASYHAPNGGYASDSGYFANTSVYNAPIRLLQNGVSGGNGVFQYSATSTFPASSFNATNYWVDVVYTQTLAPDNVPPTLTERSPAPGSVGVPATTPVSATFSEAVNPATLTSSTVVLRNAANAVIASSLVYNATTRTITLTPNAALAPSSTYTASISGGAGGVSDLAGNLLASTVTWSFTTSSGLQCPCSAWTPSTVPANPSSADTGAVELGVKFTSDIDGYITGVRFYKGVNNTGTHVGNLWSATGTLLATAVFTSETATGWQQVSFSSPVQITANTVYVASYHAPNGGYAADSGYFATGSVYNAPIRLLQNGVSGGNGVYQYSSTSTFPSLTFNSMNYWVDVVFSDVAPPDNVPPTVTNRSPAPAATGVLPTAVVTATFSEAVNPATLDSTTVVLRDASNAVVTSTVSYNAATRTVTLTPTAALVPSTGYTASISGGAGGVSDLAGNLLAATVTWGFTTGANAQCPCSAWGPTTVPGNPSDPDGAAVELGVKFTSDIDGYVTGVRFYKGVNNTGTHVGNLWSTSGTLLATAVFTSETATGWQQVTFSSPVQITANTVYVASYHAPNGRYSADGGYFANSGVYNAPIRLLQSGVSGGNGVYRYTTTSAFPSSSFNSTNYWVDVVFSQTAPADTVAPTVTARSPASGATAVAATTTVTATFSEPVNPATVTSGTVVLRNASNAVVPSTLVYDAPTRTVTLTPSAPLDLSATYTASVVGGSTGTVVRDLAGNALAATVSWSFTTGLGCGTPANAVVAENCLAGNPASEWDVNDAGDPSIQGFATEMSVNRGSTVVFKVKTDAAAYRLDIYRLGFYAGLGARRVATVTPSASLPQGQPNCLSDSATGLVDCGNWNVSASWAVPATAVSGIYLARLVRNDTGGASHVVFIVRNDAATAKVAFKTSDTTWQAYNTYGGNSLYTGAPAGRAYKVSYNRPWSTRGTQYARAWLFGAEYPMVRWLEANGYDLTYVSGIDVERTPLLVRNQRVLLSVGHDEYWSAGQRSSVEAARDAGVHLAFFSGNEMFWKTRWETSIDGSSTPYRTLVSYKETHNDAKIDPSPAWTGTWRDPRFSPPADGGRPENQLSGTIFKVNCCSAAIGIQVPAEYANLRLWRNTSVAALQPGEVAQLAAGTLGYEWDEDPDNGFRPPGQFRLSSTTAGGLSILTDYGSSYANGTATHNLTMHRRANGALVFGAGTIRWSWGLDTNHDPDGATPGYATTPDVRMQQATVNLLADMNAQPGSLQSGLVPASASTDAVAPSSTITSPTNGSTVAGTVTITGTATDAGGGQVAGVEVSIDGGATWHPATGRGTWTYTWTVATSQATVIRSRAVDDSGNLETPGAGVAVSPELQACPCTIWPASALPAVANDSDAGSANLGVRFESEQAGFITGIRFYKGPANTGTHIGALWSNTGTLLASATFTAETASGWQQVDFATPVAIAANTPYVASYLAPVGRYAFDRSYFATNPFIRAPLRALQSGASGNGVFVYSTGVAFPNSSFQSTNYWVDVVFTTADTAPPVITARTPGTAATGVAVTANVTVTFNEAMDAATINATTLELRDSTNAVVSAAVTYDANNRVATLDPGADLVAGATYTAIVRGGATDPRVKDAAGNALSADAQWTFTTVPPAVPTVTAVAPANNATSTVATANATATFSVAMDPVTLTTSTFVLRDNNNVMVPAVVTYNATNRVATLDPTASLLGGVTYTATVVSGVAGAKSTAGVPLAADRVWSFAVEGAAPTVTARSPAVGATGVSGTANVTATFSEAIDPATITTGTFELLDASNVVVPATVTYNTTNRVATLDPTPTLLAGVTYTARLRGGTSSPRITDLAGNGLAADVTWTFTVTGPSVSAVSPASAAANVAATANVTATFSVAMNPLTITASTFVLRDGAGTAVPAVVTYNATTRVATLNPTPDLAGGMVYTATVVSGDSGVKTTAAVPLAVDRVWSFTVEATPPTVTATSPANGATGVSRTANVTATFSEAMLASTINGTTFVLLDSSNAIVPAVVTYNTSNRVATLNPTPTLLPSRVYTARVLGGAADPRVKDGAGNALAADFSWSFTTVADTTAPTISARAPASGATAVSLTANVVITFNEDMDPASISASTIELRNPAGTLIPSVVTYAPASRQATLNPDPILAAFTVYTVTVRGGSVEPRVKDFGNNSLSATSTWTFRTQ